MPTSQSETPQKIEKRKAQATQKTNNFQFIAQQTLKLPLIEISNIGMPLAKPLVTKNQIS
jgi:hypothetical protein